MVWAFMGSLMICGVYDLRFKEVPLWSIVILYMVGLGVCAMHHPFLSALITIVVMLFCFVSKMGAADKMIFPIVAGVFGFEGIILVGLTVMLSIWLSRNRGVPAVTYLAVIGSIAIIGGII